MMELHAIKFFFLFFLFFACCTNAQQAPGRHMQGDSIVIFSKALQENRIIYIHTPAPDTVHPDKQYPVLYVLDGESHFDMLSQYSDYLSRWDVNVIPEMIVVGIVNTKRTRDLTPTQSIINYFGKPDTSAASWMKPSGGSGLFLQFIKNELMPFINTHYKTQPYTILAGHSFGGIASLHCLLTQPDMFNAYIAISPSLWWDSEYITKLAAKKWTTGMALNKILFYSDGSEGLADKSSFHSNVLKLDSLVAAKKMTGLLYQYKYYPTETHMTEPMPAYYDALRFIYKDWQPAKK